METDPNRIKAPPINQSPDSSVNFRPSWGSYVYTKVMNQDVNQDVNQEVDQDGVSHFEMPSSFFGSIVLFHTDMKSLPFPQASSMLATRMASFMHTYYR